MLYMCRHMYMFIHSRNVCFMKCASGALLYMYVYEMYM